LRRESEEVGEEKQAREGRERVSQIATAQTGRRRKASFKLPSR
jgi:hypothetical protein